MGKIAPGPFSGFLTPFTTDTRQKVKWLVDFVRALYPKANELIYDNYNAVVCGWSPTDRAGHIFCSVAVFRTNENLHFGFYWGSALPDPEKLLLGKGNQYRYLLVKDLSLFPKAYVKKLIREAFALSLSKVKEPAQLSNGQILVKSISASKRPANRPGSREKKKP